MCICVDGVTRTAVPSVRRTTWLGSSIDAIVPMCCRLPRSVFAPSAALPVALEADCTPTGRAFRTMTGSPGRTARVSTGCNTLLCSVSSTIRPSVKVNTPVAGS